MTGADVVDGVDVAATAGTDLGASSVTAAAAAAAGGTASFSTPLTVEDADDDAVISSFSKVEENRTGSSGRPTGGRKGKCRLTAQRQGGGSDDSGGRKLHCYF
jgi:hypothetical protein